MERWAHGRQSRCKRRLRWPQRKRAKLVFDVLAARVAAMGKDDRERWMRPETLRGISWAETPKGTRRMMGSLEKLKPEGLRAVYWLPDRDDLAPDIEPGLRERFDDRFAEAGFDEAFGQVLQGFAALPR